MELGVKASYPRRSRSTEGEWFDVYGKTIGKQVITFQLDSWIKTKELEREEPISL